MPFHQVMGLACKLLNIVSSCLCINRHLLIVRKGANPVSSNVAAARECGYSLINPTSEKEMNVKRHAVISGLCFKAFILTGLMVTNIANAEDAFWSALTGGKFDFSSRYRFEHVDDDLAPGGIPLQDAKASTIRTTLGYKTGMFQNFDARILLQDVRDVGIDDFNDGTGRPNAKVQYAVVADPSDTDFIEGYLGFSGVPGTYIKAGRQLITYRDAPHHRYIGTVLWRQNWQNH